MASPRTPEHPIDPLFVDRTSPRSFTGEALDQETLFTMLEAARWAPSSSNIQPWRFIYALRDTPQWGPIFEGLVPFNQAWAGTAGAIVVFLSEIHMMRGETRVVSGTHAFDTGSAWVSFALQAHQMGYAAHAMGGFISDKLRSSLNVPDDYAINTVAVVGRQGPADALPDGLRERETPTERRPLKDSLSHGAFGR